MAIIALVGLPGSGKSETAALLEKMGFARIRFGDATDDEIRKMGLKPGEEAEMQVRLKLREEIGMHAYAFLNLPRIKAAKGDVVLDGVHSLEEYEFLKEELHDLVVVAIHAPRDLRYRRLADRKVRPLSKEEAMKRDIEEVEKHNCLGPIARADYTLVNDGTLEDLKGRLDEILEDMKK